MRRRMDTPWGQADDVTEVAEGIKFVSTPSHGGYMLDAKRDAVVRARVPEFTPWAGAGWYEEDCDWAVVALCFPSLFPADAVEQSRMIVASLVKRDSALETQSMGRRYAALAPLLAERAS